jgi:hypothetical protein
MKKTCVMGYPPGGWSITAIRGEASLEAQQRSGFGVTTFFFILRSVRGQTTHRLSTRSGEGAVVGGAERWFGDEEEAR